MKHAIHRALTEADIQHLDDVCATVIRVFEEHKSKNLQLKIGYVSGIITSEGVEKRLENLKKLEDHTEQLRISLKFPVFSALDVFPGDLYEKVDGHSVQTDQWIVFWRNILGSGHITDVFMTPRWEISIGARDEYETAKKLNLTVHIMNNIL